MTRLLPVLLVFALLSGCDATSTVPQPEVVVESYQIAGETLRPVRLTRTVPVDEAFSAVETGVTGASVAIERLDAADNVLDTFLFLAVSGEPGLYQPEDPQDGIIPGGTYRLVADLPDGGRLTATTVVPDTISIVAVANREVVYQGLDQPSVTVTRSSADPDRQDRYVFSVTSLLDFRGLTQEELLAEMTPFYADAFDPDVDAISDLRVNSSGLLNEGNYRPNPTGTITIDVPWLGVVFYGPNRIAVNVIDQNYVDFLRSRQAQQGGRPGEIPNVLDRIDGGTGLFASFTRIEVDVTVGR